ncbi:double zinc ribbon domain-containing protein [Haloarchaeobius sp. HRN-SO-5]|uniref:double zinc ribbon domain-containing protein n=1 Tax=Haloarchaeobius sp. HRN-SO-5 TaxID=3446118 RepID=UPI003EBE1195
MAVQDELECVSCENTFDPGPTGGFCPDCDTPHPDFEMSAVDDGASESGESESDADEQSVESDAEPSEDPGEADESTDEECSSCGSTVDPDAAFCANCGAELGAEDEPESSDEDELTECPNCSNSVGDEAFCANCGTDLDAIRAGDDADAGSDDEADADDTPDSVTLVIDGESYSLGDGETFGRQDEAWLDDLVSASGGRDEASYISGEHLEFEIGDDGVFVTDLSTNGTSHNGDDLDGGRTELEDGDTLELADRATVDVEL